MTELTTDQVRRRLAAGEPFTLIEVLDPDAYDDFHLPRAINVPFGHDFAERVRYAFPDPQAEVVLYSRGPGCPALSEAAEALAGAGFSRVCLYEEGKEAWRAAGLPVVL